MFSVVNIMIGDYSVGNVLQELARCLAIFPNVHTFKLNNTQLTNLLCQAITRGFSHCNTFPQIRSVTVPKYCGSLLKSFPGVRYVRITGSAQGLSAYSASILACGPLIEHISFSISYHVELFLTALILLWANICNPQGSLPHFVQQFPNIRDLKIEFADWFGMNAQVLV